jgi:thiaminase/transcriptional activator TenA
VSLTERLWGGIEQTYAAILRHPFLAGLTDGSLDPEAFGQYVVQDALYLVDYAKALAGLASRADDSHDVEVFARHAAGAIAVERQLHDSLLGDLGIDRDAAASTAMTPTTLAYTSYLRASVATGSLAEAVGAVLPCYWIYREVGQELIDRGSPDKRYQTWIDTYAGEEFAAVVQEALDATDRLEPRLSAYDEAAMLRAFGTTSRYEWMFWDAAWRRESWPV